MLFFIKYSPKKIEDISGNEDARSRILQWMLNWMKKKRQRPILIHGPTGVGKTSVANALSTQFELTLIEMNSSDLRSKSQVERILHVASSASSLYGSLKLIFIDDVDALQSADRGGSSAITTLLKESSVPILLAATNVWDKKLSGIRAECELIEFKKINKSSIISVLKSISSNEDLTIQEEKLKQIAENSGGDLRAAINDLQSNSSVQRDTEKDIFERVRAIFKSMSYSDAKKASSGDIDYDMLKLWVDENIPIEYLDPVTVANAFNYLSRADIFDSRIRKSNYWSYFKYSIDFLTAGIALSKDKRSSAFTRYQYPSYLRLMGQTIDRRAKLKSIGKKIGRITHTNYRDSSQYLEIIRHYLGSNMEKTLSFYNFDEEEAAFIIETTPDKIKKSTTTEKKEDLKEDPKKAELKEPELKKKPTSKGSLKDFF